MQRKGVDLEQIYDTEAVRILVDEINDCYVALGAVHGLWRPIPGEFDDYIANPEGNMYRSLHTGVVGPGGRSLEVQIRTYEMHRSAELGIAAHWRYKEQSKRDVEFENRLAWLRGLMDWGKDVKDASEFVYHAGRRLRRPGIRLHASRRPERHACRSTPIDFAYVVHTEVGHRCREARQWQTGADRLQLANGDQVEIITSKRGGPSRDWMNPSLRSYAPPGGHATRYASGSASKAARKTSRKARRS